jgi:uncharacterized protein YegP (UPF0339 family)
VTSPLVYLFAAAACVLAAFFGLAAVLAFRHARGRSKCAKDLRTYLDVSGSRMTSANIQGIEAAQRQRASVMHITIGDLVRDEGLVAAAAVGISQRRRALNKQPTSSREPAVGPRFVLKRDHKDQYYFDVVAPDGSVTARSESYESKAAALNGIASMMIDAPSASVEEER